MMKMMKKAEMNMFILILRSVGRYSSIIIFVRSIPRNISIKNISISVPVMKNKSIMNIIMLKVIFKEMFRFFSIINNGIIIPIVSNVRFSLMLKGFDIKRGNMLKKISINPIITAFLFSWKNQ